MSGVVGVLGCPIGQALVGAFVAVVLKVRLQPLMTIGSRRVLLEVDVLVLHRSPQTQGDLACFKLGAKHKKPQRERRSKGERHNLIQRDEAGVGRSNFKMAGERCDDQGSLGRPILNFEIGTPDPGFVQQGVLEESHE